MKMPLNAGTFRTHVNWQLLAAALVVLLLGLAGLVALWTGLQTPVEQASAVGDYGDWEVLRGWYEAEFRDGVTRRWSAEQAALHFAPLGSGMAVLQLRLEVPAVPGTPAQVGLAPEGRAPVRFAVDKQRRVYTLLLPVDADGLDVELTSTTQTPPGDRRALGVGITAVSLRGPLAPGQPLPLLLPAALGALLLEFLVVWLCSGARWKGLFWAAWLVGPLVLAALGALAWAGGVTLRPVLLDVVRYLPWLALALLALSALLVWRLGRAEALPWLVLGAAVAIAAALRFWGLDWDGLYVFHPDEWVFDLASVQLKPPWHPGFFAYGSLLLYLYRATAELLTAAGGRGWLALDQGRFALIGRLYSAAASTATVAVVALLGRRAGYARSAGLWAAMFLAGAVLAIQNAHYGTTDSVLTLEVTLLAYVSLCYVQRGRAWTAVAAGALLGMALATKITAATFAIFPAIALILRAVRRPGDELGIAEGSRGGKGQPTVAGRWATFARHAGLLVAAALLACFALAPYYFLDWRGLLGTLGTEQGDASTGLSNYTYQFIDTPPYLYQLRNALYTLGPPLLLLALAGSIYLLVRTLRRRNPADLLLVGCPTIYFLFMGTFFTKYTRYMLPLLPFLGLFAGLLLAEMARWGERRGWPIVRWLAWLLGGGTVLLTLGYALLFARGVYGRPDPRLQASLWIYQRAAKGSTILIEEHDQQLPVRMREPDNPLATKFGPYLYAIDTLRVYTPPLMESPAYYAQALGGADYLVMASRNQNVTFRRFPDLFPVRACLYRQLFDGKLGYTLVQRFTRGPQLRSWRIDGEDDPNIEETFQVFDHPTVLIFARTAAPDAVEQAVRAGCP